MQSSSGLVDAIQASLDMARALPRDGAGIVGYGICELRDGDGQLILVRPFANLITNYGDLWYAQKGITAIPPASPAAPTALTGMQIGSGTTALNKAADTGMGLTTLLAGQAFDATFPSTNNLGNNLGVEAVYKTTYAAGTGTGTVNEATITNGTIGTLSTAGNSISRVLTGAITKGASDSLAITWRHKFLGA
jgi:hypothetical protein